MQKLLMKVLAFTVAFTVVWVLLACVTDGRVQAQDSDGSLGPQTVLQRTGILWPRITKEKVGANEIVRTLGKPFPEGTTASDSSTTNQISGDEATRLAQEFILTHSTLFVPEQTMGELKAPDVAVTDVIANANTGAYAHRGTDYTVVMAQRHQEIPVFEGACLVSLTRTGEIWKVKNRFGILETPPTVATVTAADALAAARAYLGDAGATPEADAQLFIFAPSRLTWRFNFLQPHGKEILVDATTRDIVLSRKNVRDDLPSEMIPRPSGQAPQNAPTESGSPTSAQVEEVEAKTEEVK